MLGIIGMSILDVVLDVFEDVLFKVIDEKFKKL